MPIDKVKYFNISQLHDDIYQVQEMGHGGPIAVKKALEQAGTLDIAAKSENEEQARRTYHLETDVVIVGAGSSGLAAAVTAGEQGMKSLVFEKNSNIGGTGSMVMGPLGIDTQIQKDNFNDLSVKEAFNEHMNYTDYRVNAALRVNATWHIVQPEDGSQPGPAAAS